MTSHRSAVYVLPLSALTRARFFEPPKPGALAEMVAQVSVPGMTFACRYNFEDEILTITPDPMHVSPSFEVALVTNKAGRRYIVCNCCGQPRNLLVLDAHRLICRVAYVEDGTGPSKAMRDARLKVALDNPTTWVTKEPEVLGIPEAQFPGTLPDDIDEPSAKRVRFSTEKAIALGRGAGQFDLYESVSNEPPDFFEAVAMAPKFVRPECASLTDAHPILDINIFRCLMAKDLLIGKTLCWGERAEPHDEVLFFVNWRGDMPIIIAVHDPFASIKRWQRLPLSRQGSGRFRFICPVTTKGCQILYLRNGLFASREAQWLYHPSQRANGRRNKRLAKTVTSIDEGA